MPRQEMTKNEMFRVFVGFTGPKGRRNHLINDYIYNDNHNKLCKAMIGLLTMVYTHICILVKYKILS